MEILIIGGIIVVIMVIVSTTIKRSAAGAYEAEEIETDRFTITKPQGFLHPLRDNSEFLFEAYSRLFGDRETRNIWRARARLRLHEDSAFDDILRETEESELESGLSVEEGTDAEGRKTAIVRSRKTEDEQEYSVIRKFIELPEGGGVYELRVTILEPYSEDFEVSARILTDSFSPR